MIIAKLNDIIIVYNANLIVLLYHIGVIDTNYPKLLDSAFEHLNWRYEDVFEEHQFEYTKAFIHQNYSIGMHSHNFYEINIILNGTGRHYLERFSYPVSRCSLFVIPPGIQHGYWQEQDLDVCHILISQQFLQRYADELSVLPGYSILFDIEPQLRAHYEETMYPQISEDQLSSIMPLLTAMLEYGQSDYPGRYVIKNAVALAIIGQLCSYANYMDHTKLGDGHAQSILRCMEYIQRHLDEKLTVNCLANRYHMSRATFLRHFSRICRRTPYQYILECRIKKAKFLLSNSEQPLSAVAQECGFFDSSHLIRVFERSEGITPTQYRIGAIQCQ